MISFLYRTDVHVSDKSPGSWKGDYPAEIWSNIEQVGNIAREREVTAVLDGGDFFHVKAAARNPHSLISQTANTHRPYGCPIYCVEGNHDMSYNNLKTIDQQPLGVLYATGVFQHLREQVFIEGDMQVRVVGVPYSPFRTLGELRAIQKKPGDTYLIAVVHALAGESPPPMVEDFFNEPVFTYADLVTPNGPDHFCFGHWHRDQGIVKIGNTTFVNQGALSRGALINENLIRIPKVAWIQATTSGLTVEPIPMQVAPASEVFDIEKKERKEAEAKSIDQFVQRLQMDAQFNTSLSIEQNVQSLGFAADVKELVLRYLEQARSEVG
jgi:DNA repair exonuclease SbcCD nuclease subunit